MNGLTLHLKLRFYSQNKTFTNCVKPEISKDYFRLRIQHSLQLRWPAVNMYPFKLENQCFNETFLVLKSTNSLILDNPLFEKHNNKTCPKNNVLQFSDTKKQVNSIKETEHENKKTKKSTKTQFYFQKLHSQTRKNNVTWKSTSERKNLENVTEVVVPNQSLDEPTQTSFTSSLCTISSEKKLYISFLNLWTIMHITKQDRNWKLWHSNVWLSQKLVSNWYQ